MSNTNSFGTFLETTQTLKWQTDKLGAIIQEQNKVLDAVATLASSRLGPEWYTNIAAVLTAYEAYEKFLRTQGAKWVQYGSE